MVRHCSAYRCSNSTRTKSAGITFHRFPRDPTLLRLWTVAVNREGWQPASHSTLCSAHFKDADLHPSLKSVRLQAGAVPSIFDFSNQITNKEGLKMESGAFEAKSTNCEPRSRLEPVSRENSPSPGDCEDILDPMQMVHVKMELPDQEDVEATADPGYPHSGSRLRFAATIDEENTRIELAEGRRTFCCLQCDYKTTHRWSQRKHLIVHSKNKPFKCNLCEYTCVRLAGLKRHTKVHTGDRPYSCTVCDYTCSEKSTLLQHMAMHTGIKPYSCQLCSYRCSRSGHLTQHMAKHSGLKPHKCELCSASFALRGNLYQHLDRMHDGRRPRR